MQVFHPTGVVVMLAKASGRAQTPAFHFYDNLKRKVPDQARVSMFLFSFTD
jgi:hypothetical protein